MTTLLELKDWIEQGEKIRCVDWDDGCYLKKGKDEKFYDEDGNRYVSFSPSVVFSDEWEKVENEPARWTPSCCDNYYVVEDNVVFSITCFNDYIDCRHFEVYNCFKTREEAERARDLWLAERELRSLADGGDFVIKYEDDRGFYVDKYFHVATPYHFPTEYAAKEAIKQLGEDKLKLIFGVK